MVDTVKNQRVFNSKRVLPYMGYRGTCSVKACGLEPFWSQVWLWFVHSGFELGVFAMNYGVFSVKG